MDGKTPDADTLRAAIERHQRVMCDAFLHGTNAPLQAATTRGESPLLTLDRLRDAMAELPAPPVLAGVPIIVSEYVPTTEIVDHLTRSGRSLLRRMVSVQLFGLGVRSGEEEVDHVFLLETDDRDPRQSGPRRVVLASPRSAAVLKSYPPEVHP